MESIFLATIFLRNPSFSENEEEYLCANLVFDKQPTSKDVVQAFSAEPQLFKRSDFAKYHAALVDGLNTYGVPRLHRHRMTDEDGYNLAVPRVLVKWYMNIVGRTSAESEVEYGSFALSERLVNAVPAAEPDTV
jgi:hypothetical protein